MSEASLHRKRRVRKRSEFLFLQSRGRKVRSEHFLLVYSPAQKRNSHKYHSENVEAADPESRLGITVTRKIDKRAVVRNQIKRRIRNIFRVIRADFQAAFDVVVIAQDGSNTLRFSEIESELCSLLQKAQILPRTQNTPSQTARSKSQPHRR